MPADHSRFVCKFALLCAVVFLLFSMTSAQASPRQDVIAGPVAGKVIGILDGDTVSVLVHVWIGQQIETSVRIAGIDTPEIKGKCEKERNMALAARGELEKLLESGDIILSAIKLEKYAGRVLANAFTTEGVNIADYLIGKGLARPYQGKKRAGWC